MRFQYDSPTDSLYIHFVDGSGTDTIIINDDVIADIDSAGKLIGIDIQHASKQVNLNQFIVDGLLTSTQK